ncbi:MAG: ABC transporter permease [Spirochaetaceae bacterium]|jgi:microcin C transport system permease protein|nr:ABC transporter permease [Spirochaetaceae bacterium]
MAYCGKGADVATSNKKGWLNGMRFTRNRRGFIALIIFGALFVLSLGAEFLANDRPLIVRYKNNFYFPVFKNYSELLFDGEFDINADYRDPYIIEKINADGWMLMPPIAFSYNTINYDLPSPAPSPPTPANILGTDDSGRDVAARLIYGFRISVLFGFILTIICSIIGVTLGALQGYYGGLFDLVFQRFIEVWAGMPTLFILIILSSIIEPTFWWLLAINLLFGWMGLVGMVRAEFLRARNFEYVLAARAMGMSHARIIFLHILPNALGPALSQFPFILAGSITILTSLDFLGFGLPVGSPSLGELLKQAKANLQAPWLGVSVFTVLAVSLALLVWTGEAIRDAFDPRSRAR